MGMWDWLSLIVAPVSGAVSLAGLLGMLSVILRWQARRRYERRVYARFVQVQHDLKSWQCWRCKHYFESQARPRPLCLCNGCLVEYLEKVA